MPTRQYQSLEPRPWFERGGQARNANRKGLVGPRGIRIFSQRDCQPRQGRSDTEGYRACPHEHNHDDIWSWAVIDQGRDAQRGDVSCEKRKGETNGNAHRRVAGSLHQQRRLDQCRPLPRAHRPDLRHVMCVADNCSRSANCLARSIRLPRGFALQSKHAPVRIADPFIMIVHTIGSSCTDNVQIRDNRAVTIKTFFSSALDTSSARSSLEASSANRLRARAQHTDRREWRLFPS
jgi:hypothetical protein